MREIKFRAWDKEFSNIVQVVNFSGFPSDSRYEYMQYTGLKDKNGKEIYDGDLIQLTSVTGADRGIYTVALEEYLGDEYMEYGYCWYNYLPSGVEVIGNIYENPELLK